VWGARLNGALHYLAKQASLGSHAVEPTATPYAHSLADPSLGSRQEAGQKLRNTRVTHLRKAFLKAKFTYFRQMRSTFFHKKLRRRVARRLVGVLSNGGLLKSSRYFALNTFRVVNRIFPALDRNTLRLMFANGQVLVNQRAANVNQASLAPGDFVRLAPKAAFVAGYS
jgi:hypothetical protein